MKNHTLWRPRRQLHTLALLSLSLLPGLVWSQPLAVSESPRQVPVVYDVDVAVVGGSSGAASAALAAAQAGARVFLLAPRPYLGDDLCETRRLWLERDEKPVSALAVKLFTPPKEPVAADPSVPSVRDPNALDFAYQASLDSAPKHKENARGTKLADGAWARPESESVQYDGDVTLVADLGAVKPVREARLFFFHRPGDFAVGELLVSSSPDQAHWSAPIRLAPADPREGANALVATLSNETRYVRFKVRRQEGCARLLLGEIEIVGPAPLGGGTVAGNVDLLTLAETNRVLVKPLHIKRMLDEALLEAGVEFLFSCLPTELLRDDQGRLCGLVMANRSGRQAVRARVIIDATPRAAVARMAGARFAPFPAGEQTFTRVVIGGDARQGPQLTGRKLGLKFRTAGKTAPREAELIEYTLRLPMKDGSFGAYAEADQLSRDLIWHPAMLDVAEALFQVPPDPLRAEKSDSGAWRGVAALDLGVFRPQGITGLHVLGGCAAVSREAAGRLLRPLAFLEAGERVGKAAAHEARGLKAGQGIQVAAGPQAAELSKTMAGDTREFLVGVRPTQRHLPTVPSPQRRLPVFGRYDCVVVGGGTGGAPAGIGASRGGAKTLLLEFINGLGGVGTQGRIITYYHGYRGGFTAQVDAGIRALGMTNFVLGKTEYWRRANREAGTEIWFGVIGCGALVDRGVVKGVVVATPLGRGVVLAKTVIDSTGNADIAAAAGAECDYTGAEDIAVQGAGLPPYELGDHYSNTDYTFADDTDVVDFWQHFITSRLKFKSAHDLGQLVDTRERRRIVGEVTLSPMDIILERTWPDSVNQAWSNFDTHGFTTHPVFYAMPPDRVDVRAWVPLRALTPKGLDGILVTGLGASAHRDAMPIIRMQPDVQNQGYACGRIAAMVARAAASARQVDIKELQRHLVEMEALPPSVLTDVDSLPAMQQKLATAVAELVTPQAKLPAEIDSVVRNRPALATLFLNPDASIPLLEMAHAQATGVDQLAYAVVLGLMGRPAAADTLLPMVRNARQFDRGWNYTGMGQFGRSVSELDADIIALGHTRDPRALEVVLDKLKMLDASKEFSHHRACALALETLADHRAAPALAELLRKPDMMGHAFTTIQAALAGVTPNRNENHVRNVSLRELTLARALYRCGDHEGLGEMILNEYVVDLRGHYARHARAVLEEKPRRPVPETLVP